MPWRSWHSWKNKKRSRRSGENDVQHEPERQPEESLRTEEAEEYLYRDRERFSATTFENLYENNHEEFQAQTRMTPRVFYILLKLVAERLTRNSIRTPIPPECRLFLTLRYLASGEGTGRLAKSFKMSHSTVRAIIRETCDVFWTTLSPTFLSQPEKEEELRAIVRVPDCLGAVEKKILSLTDSILVRPLNLQVGWIGTMNLDRSFLVITCLQGWVPEMKSMPYGYAFIASSAFPLGNQLIRSYPTPTLEHEQLLYNQNLAIALEGTINKAFRVLKSRWRVLSETIYCSKAIADKLVAPLCRTQFCQTTR